MRCRCLKIFFLIFIFFLRDLSFALENNDSELREASSKIKILIQAYTTRLFPHHDPFARVFSIESGKALFERMNQRSSLSRVNFALKNFIASETALDKKLINEVISDSTNLITRKRCPQIDLQSNLLALQFLSQYLQRFEAVEESDKSNDENKKDDQDTKDENTKGDKQKQKPRYPETPDKYKPNTKDTEKDKSKGEKEDQYIVAEVNFETPYFGQRYFSEIIRGAQYPLQEANLPGIFQNPSTNKDSNAQLILHTYGNKKVRIFLPPSYKPLQASDPRVEVLRNTKGSYDLTMSTELDEVIIPLSSSTLETLSPPLLEIYTRPVGFKLEEWPSLIKTTLFQAFKPEEDHTKNVEHLSQAIAAHIASKYLYSVGERSETDPIKALEAGAFQCDMAAYTMVSLLRDVYKIPSRVVGGFRAKKHKNGADKKSYLVMPGEAHAWVEVYNEGRWIPFDPTPVKKDKKDKQDEEGEKDEYSDRDLPNPLVEPPEEDKDSKDGTPDSQAKGDEKRDKPLSKEEQLKKDTEDRLKDFAKDKNSTKTEDTKDKKDALSDINSEELASKLELGSLELEPSPERNPFRERALRVLLQVILDPNNKGSVTLDLLNKAKSLFRSVKDNKLEEIYNGALRIHENEHENLENWIRYTDLMLNKRDLASTYKDVYRAKKSVEFFTSVLDEETDRALASALIHALNKVQSEIYGLSHVDSQEISAVKAFYDSLPPLVQNYLQQQYSLKTVGPNAPTKEIARLMHEGKMYDLRLLASLYPVTDFIMSSTPRPEFQEVLSWLRDLPRPMGRNLMPLQRFAEMARAILMQPGLSIEDNIKENTAYVMTRRKHLQLPTGRGKEDSEKITIVLYDISGSMGGDPAKFQAGLISAFTARALSEISASGHHKHRVLLIPFDDKPGEPTRITTTQEALDLIHNYASKLARAGGGTDIQKAMIQALALIADAEKRAGEPLAAANIVLMSDGGSQVNLEELTKARNAIDRRTPVQAMFIAIGDTNQDLIKFAMDSRSIGFENGFYSEFTRELMHSYLFDAAKKDLKVDSSVLYTEHSTSSLSSNVSIQLQEASRLAILLSERAKDINKTHKLPLQYYKDLESLSWKNIKHNRPLAQHLERLRIFAKSYIFKNRSLLEKVCDDLMIHMETLTRIPLNEFDDIEQEQLRHFLNYAGGVEK